MKRKPFWFIYEFFRNKRVSLTITDGWWNYINLWDSVLLPDNSSGIVARKVNDANGSTITIYPFKQSRFRIINFIRLLFVKTKVKLTK